MTNLSSSLGSVKATGSTRFPGLRAPGLTHDDDGASSHVWHGMSQPSLFTTGLCSTPLHLKSSLLSKLSAALPPPSPGQLSASEAR